MLHQSLKQLLRNANLKCTALILGYTFWYFFSAMHWHKISLTVPINIHTIASDTTIKAPESITIELAGKRAALRFLDRSPLSLRLCAEQLALGPNKIVVSPANLFLPDTVQLTNYYPSNLIVTVKKTATKDSYAS